MAHNKNSATTPLRPTRNDLMRATRESVVELLAPRLLASVELYLRCKHAHWNVKGPQFSELHELFDEVAADTLEYADEFAERIVQLGGTASASAREVASGANLSELAGPVQGWEAFTDYVADLLAVYGKSVRAGIDEATQLGDADTADLFTEVSRGVDKWLWMVEAHVQR